MIPSWIANERSAARRAFSAFRSALLASSFIVMLLLLWS
jgi:hypothetical protein